MRIDEDYHFELKAKYQKLLAFVKDIENYTFDNDFELPAKEYKGTSIFTAAKELLKEMGEI